jgi:hypothetical protein
MKPMQWFTMVALLTNTAIPVYSSSADSNTNAYSYPETDEMMVGLDSAHMDKLLADHQRIFGVVLTNFDRAIIRLDGMQEPLGDDPARSTVRRFKTDLWLRLLEDINTTRDFGYADKPFMRVMAPAGYDSGIPPSAIAEPAKRRAYNDLIRRNRERNARYEFERRLDDLATQAADHATRYILRAYRKTPDDIKELTRQLDTLTDPKLQAQMKGKLRDILQATTN